MRFQSIGKHIGIAFALLSISTVMFFAFPGRAPHPEDFSPFGYLIAFALSLFAMRGLPQENGRRWYWAFAGLCLFLALEEISFGVESEWLPALYWPKYDLEIYDLHNLIPASLRILGAELGIRVWDRNLLLRYLGFDAALLFAGLLFAYALTYFHRAQGAARGQQLSAVLGGALSSLASLAAILHLGSLARDPKNAVLLGYSLERLMPMLLIGVWGSVALGVCLAMLQPKWREDLMGRLEQVRGWGWLKARVPGLAIVGLGAAAVLQLITPINLTAQRLVLLERLIPILYWGMAQALLLWVLFKAADGGWLDRLASLPSRVRGLFEAHPAAFYALLTLGLIALAQTIDKDWLSVERLFRGVDFWVDNWSLYIEEFLEAAGGILMAAGTFFFPREQSA